MDYIVGSVVLIAALLIAVYYCLQTAVALGDGDAAAAPAPTALELVFERNGIVVRSDEAAVRARRPVSRQLRATGDGGRVRVRGGVLRDPRVERVGPARRFRVRPDAGTAQRVRGQRVCGDADVRERVPRPDRRPGRAAAVSVRGGELDIDLVGRQFSANDCRCAAGFRKMVFDQTALARSIPVCIPSRLADVYSRFYTAPVD